MNVREEPGKELWIYARLELLIELEIILQSCISSTDIHEESYKKQKTARYLESNNNSPAYTSNINVNGKMCAIRISIQVKSQIIIKNMNHQSLYNTNQNKIYIGR